MLQVNAGMTFAMSNGFPYIFPQLQPHAHNSLDSFVDFFDDEQYESSTTLPLQSKNDFDWKKNNAGILALVGPPEAPIGILRRQQRVIDFQS